MNKKERQYLEAVQRRIDLDEAILVWGGVVGAALIADIGLLYKGKRSMSRCVRDNKYTFLCLTGIFALHVAEKLGRFDPFRIPRWAKLSPNS